MSDKEFAEIDAHRRLGESRAEIVHNERGRREDDPVGTEAPDDDEPLHLGAAVLPLAGEAR